jgi:hypothetical protein
MRSKTTPFKTDTVEAITSGVAADPKAPTGEWLVRQGTIWQSNHPVVRAHPAWFCELGQGQTTPAYMPGRAA